MHCLQYETRVPVILISVQNFHVLPFSLPFQIHPALSVFVSYKTTYQSSIRRKAKFPNPFLFLLVYVSTSRRVERKKKRIGITKGEVWTFFRKRAYPPLVCRCISSKLRGPVVLLWKKPKRNWISATSPPTFHPTRTALASLLYRLQGGEEGRSVAVC